jgi:quinol monooxygenase YgiN
LNAFEQHLAQPHSVAFRFAVQNLPPPDTTCCIGSPIDDRQYSLIKTFGTPWISTQLPMTVGSSGALFVITYVDFLQALLEEGNAGKAQNALVQYGAATRNANPMQLLSYTVLRQLNRPNRYAILEVWATGADYDAWQGSAVTSSYVAQITPLLGSPLDHRLNSLCGETYIDGTGCVPP